MKITKKIFFGAVFAVFAFGTIGCSQIASNDLLDEKVYDSYEIEDDNSRHIFHGGGSGDVNPGESGPIGDISIFIPGCAPSSPSNKSGSSKKGGR